MTGLEVRPDFINRIVNSDGVREFIRADGQSMDWTPIVQTWPAFADVVVLSNGEDALAAFELTAPGIYQSHTMFRLDVPWSPRDRDGQVSERSKSALLPQPGMRVLMDDAAGRAALSARNPFAGLSGEQIFVRLDAMAGSKGDAARFKATMNALSPEEANAVRATFIDQAGRATPGAQNADGSAFSIARWLTRWTPDRSASSIAPPHRRSDRVPTPSWEPSAPPTRRSPPAHFADRSRTRCRAHPAHGYCGWKITPSACWC